MTAKQFFIIADNLPPIAAEMSGLNIKLVPRQDKVMRWFLKNHVTAWKPMPTRVVQSKEDAVVAIDSSAAGQDQLRKGATVADSPRIGVIGRDSFGPTLSRVLFPAHLHDRARTDAATEEAEWRAVRNTRRIKEGKKTYVVVDTREDGSEQIVGYAQWETPESLPPASTGPKPADETEVDVPPPSLDQDALREAYRVMEVVTEQTLGKEGHSQMWYLMILGVDPTQKRRGIGKMLVKHGLEQAAREKRDAFLIATPEGKYLYSSLGFEQVGEQIALGDVPHYAMLWKRPREEEGGEVLLN
ncbi:hypothetical protein QBC41DRAFT_384847 [Cercophora samala]|uniref:N-acetyltransferase domain-containing protein n=1 Tax=Cercophora samala TaxID=330535 RepID=A0AA39ZIM0_9PEZI|nr:hypothetical protein QBC41DRAFT_384847 [Cercophora samala]